MTEYYAIKVAHNTFDVFEGTQWGVTDDERPNTSWTRLKAGRNGVYVAKGRSLPHAVVRALAAGINPHEQTQLINIA